VAHEELGQSFSRAKAIRFCEEKGGRLAYRDEIWDGKKLIVNEGKPLPGDKWTPVLDGDPKKDNEGVGWVQVGDNDRCGKNHKEAHNGDCGWGGEQPCPYKKSCVLHDAKEYGR
jgi:hypothetical protein